MDEACWNQAFQHIERSTLEQCWAYGDAVDTHFGMRPERGFLREGERAVGIVQIFDKPILRILSVGRILRGPLWMSPTPETATQIAACRAIRRARLRRRAELLFWSPELPAGDDSNAIMRAASLRQVATGYSTVWIDLGKDEAALRAQLHGKWRNALNRAEEGPVKADPSSLPPRVEAFLEGYECHLKRARYIGPSTAFLRTLIERLEERRALTLLIARYANKDVAAVLFAHHGKSATYYAAWTTDTGRTLRAHHLLVWRGITELKSRGIGWLDLGGVNAASAPGVARFKLGMGGTLETLAGVYL